MIPLLLFFLTINFQSDFKGFSSKDEALYYSELLKCEGYFTKNDNEKIFYFPCSSESELQSAYQEIEVEPTVTEIWDPEPDVVNPGNSFRDAPTDAIILFSKDNLSEWVHKNGKEAKWIVKDDYFTVNPGTGDILTKKSFGSCQLHVEFRTPADIESSGQGRGNSGVYFMEDPNTPGDSGYEIQVLDSYENRTYSNGQAASVYKQHIPLVNSSKKPGEWQSYDIIFKAPIFSERGTLESPAYVTVFHNGVLVQNNVQIQGYVKFIGYPEYKAHPSKLPLKLQDHSNKVNYRNIWVREL